MLWQLTDDDREAIETEHLYEQRTQKEKEDEHLLLKEMDMRESEDQDDLDQEFQNTLAHDPFAELRGRESDERIALFEEQERFDQHFWKAPVQPTEMPILQTQSKSYTLARQIQQLVPVTEILRAEQVPESQGRKSQTTTSDKKQLTPYSVAQQLLKREILLICGNLVYYYDHRIYRALVKEAVQRLILSKQRKDISKVGTSRFLKEVFDFVFLEQDIVVEELLPSPDVVVFLDGVLNLQTGIIIPHSSDIIATRLVRANVGRGMQQSCPHFDHFLQTVSQGDPLLEARILEAIGYILSQDHRGKCLFVVQGPTNSGKSVFERLLKSFLKKVTFQPFKYEN